MRFGPETLGLLVRPRILTSANVLPLNTKEPLPSSLITLKPVACGLNPYIDPEKLFGRSLNSLFSDINLGDTNNANTKSYTAKVVAYLVKIGAASVVVDSTNVQETLTKVRKRYGIRTNFKILSVGVEFFQGFEERNGRLEPIKPLPIKTQDGSETIWFYKPWELVPLTEIVKYESVRRGDLVMFQKSHGLVVRKKLLNKPKFYMTSSWSCYSITLLNHTGDGFTRFLPDRKFFVRRREQQDEFLESGSTEPDQEHDLITEA